MEYKVTPVAADTPTITGDALVLLIDAGSTHTAVNTAGDLTITDNVPGVAGNSVVFTDVSTDTVQVAVVTPPAGGAD